METYGCTRKGGGGWGGADRETDTQDARDNLSVDEGTLSRAKPTRRVEGLMSIADRRNREGSRASGVGMHLVACPVMPAGETTDSRPPRGAPSPFAPPHTHTPKPSTTSRIGRGGGCKPAYGTLGRQSRRGHWSAEARGLVALGRTDDGGEQTLEESWRNTQKRAERGHIGRK